MAERGIGQYTRSGCRRDLAKKGSKRAGGFYLVAAYDLGAVTALAAKIAVSKYGAIEVRPEILFPI